MFAKYLITLFQKKTYYICLIFCLHLGVFSNLNAQIISAYQDAIDLAKAFNEDDPATFYEILGYYAEIDYQGRPGEPQIIQSVLKEQKNSILLQYAQMFEEKMGQRPVRPQSTPNRRIAATLHNTNGGSTGLGFTGLADGFSRFVVGRVKQEIVNSFFTTFQEDFEENEEMPILFSTTHQYLEVMENQSSNMMMDVLRESFAKDLKNIPNNLPRLASTNKYQRLAQQYPTLRTTLATAAAANYLVENKKHPAKVIDRLTNLEYIKNSENVGAKRALNTLAFVSNSLRDAANPSSEWLTPDRLDYLESIPAAPIFFMGLNYQLHGHLIKDLVIDPNTFEVTANALGWEFGKYTQLVNMQDIVSAYRPSSNARVSLKADSDIVTNSTYEIFRPYFRDFLTLSHNVDLHLEDLKSREDATGQMSFTDYMKYVEVFLDVLRYAILNKSFGSPESVSAVEVAIPALIDMRKSIQAEEYKSAVVYLNVVLFSALPESEAAIKQDLLKYGLFMANVTNARTSEEVRLAVEAVALPVGSAAVKRRSQYNISLNTYAGPFIAQEYLFDRTTEPWATSGGLFAPIGIAISKGTPYGSLSFYASIIDLGALVNFRFKDPNAQRLPEFKLQNVLAPGGYIIYGIPKVPVSIGGGVQYGPQLREITSTAATIDFSSAYRWSLFVGIDIPLLNFYTVE
ncbi:MAG: hypothetical protein ACPG5B_10090 [Chitinophagales bacterium]